MLALVRYAEFGSVAAAVCWSDHAAVQMLIPTILADLLSSEMVTH